jgi:lysine 6-dehydrogenase
VGAVRYHALPGADGCVVRAAEAEMSYRYAVLGAGRQGVAIAYDLAQNGEAEQVLLIDSERAAVAGAVQRLTKLLPARAGLLRHAVCDVAQPEQVAMLLQGMNVAVSAVPYRFNVALTDAAISARCSLCDLGGNTAVVRGQLERHGRAAKAGVSIVPDCGLCPGLGNHLATHGIGRMDQPEHVHIRCGGLPERPVGPLGYKLVFNFQGLINEYSGQAEFLRDGRVTPVATLTELEAIEFDAPVGPCEAAVTSGGTSTCPQTFAGRLRTYDYKTVRYPGHFTIVRALFELGCFDESVTLRDGTRLAPRTLMRQLMEERLAFPNVRDVVVLRVTVSGRRGANPCTLRYDVFDRHDPATGFSAMERTTGFPAALVAYMQARELVEPGARPLEISVPAETFYEELPRHGIRVTLCEA